MYSDVTSDRGARSLLSIVFISKEIDVTSKSNSQIYIYRKIRFVEYKEKSRVNPNSYRIFVI